MKKRLFLLFSISLFAFVLVSIALTAASAASVDKPNAADVHTPALNTTHQFPINNSSQATNPPSSSFSGIDQRNGAENTTHRFNPVDQIRQEAMNTPLEPYVLDRVEFWLNQSNMSYMWGHADPGDTITITTPYEQFNASADLNGDWGTDAHALYPEDEVTVEASLGYSLTVSIPDPLEAHADSSLGKVWGEIGGWYNQEVEVHRWWGGDPNPLLVQTDTNGAFVATDENMPRGAMGYIRFVDEVNTIQVIYHRPYYDFVPRVRVNYGHDWVEGEYEPGFTVWLTLTNSTGDIKATANGDTGMIPWWGGNTGFSTNYNLFWSTGQTPPDIQGGDWIYVSFENGYSNQMQLGTIEGVLDFEVDTLAGNIYAPFTQTLYGNCGVAEENGVDVPIAVDPNGGSYFCDFGALGWDLLPGQNVEVRYDEPDTDQVYNVFRGPAPHLWINTWGQGEAAVGGNYVLNVNYKNNGDAIAEDVTISATLLNGMTYLGDTSGVIPTGDGQPGNPLVWQIGDLPVDWWSEQHFEVFVHLTANVGDQIDHAVNIETTTTYYQGDPWSKYSYWSGIVVENNTDVNIGKNVWTWDPAPENNFVYAVNVCGVGTTASTEVTLTDNLPPSTTLLSWWAQHPGWVEVSSSEHQLVVSRPSVPSGWCGEVYLRVHLDEGAWEGMELVNNAEVSADNDLDLSNNSISFSHNVGRPHTNLTIWKDWNWGSFVPGGEVYYEYRYQNTGNLPVENVLVTNTLPAGTSFSFAFTWWDWGWIPITPTITTPEYLVWDVGLLENGYGQALYVVLQIDPQTGPGSLLTHTVEISPQPWEDRYDDNIITWIERVNEPGPNLSVDKHTNWYWTWEGQLEYELRIRNLGTEPLDNIWIMDTYPTSTSFNDGWWQGHGPWITYTHDAQNHQLGIWVDYLTPGETASIGYQLDLDPGVIGEQGLAFTNTVDAPIANDTNPADNTDTVVAYTGPDVYIEKELSGGELRAGESVTFTVEFGNKNRWPWSGSEYGSHILDALPAGMTFIAATDPEDPDHSWEPILLPGNQLLWEWGTMWANSVWAFDIVVQVDETVLGRDVLINHIEAYGDSPDEIDPNLVNNISEVRVTRPIIHFPLVFKNH